MCRLNRNNSKCRFEERFGVKNIAKDESGYCILHSRNIIWKKKSNFSEIILSIANNDIENSNIRNIDFDGVEFDSSINDLLRLEFKNKCLVLDNSKIHADVSVKKQAYEGAISFRNATIEGNLSFSETSFNGIDLNGITVKGNFFASNINSKSYFYLEDSDIHGGLIFTKVLFNHVFSINETKVNSDSEFLRHTHFNNCTFRNQSDFKKTHFKKAFVLTNCSIHDRMYFDNTIFECDLYSPIFGSVHFSYVTIERSGALKFMGKNEMKIFDTSSEVIFENNIISGELSFENCNLQKIADRYRLNIISESKKINSKIFIGKGCLKYRNQSPIRTVAMNVDNQNLVIDLCNTFSKFFSKSVGYNLGLEIIERNKSVIKYFYFSDEPISHETFIEHLNVSELNMWSLVRIDKQTINSNPEIISKFPDKMINITDTIIDLTSIILKIASRIPLLKLSREEINNILNSSNFSGKKIIDNNSISVININQNILLGIGNVQTTKLK